MLHLGCARCLTNFYQLLLPVHFRKAWVLYPGWKHFLNIYEGIDWQGRLVSSSIDLFTAQSLTTTGNCYRYENRGIGMQLNFDDTFHYMTFLLLTCLHQVILTCHLYVQSEGLHELTSYVSGSSSIRKAFLTYLDAMVSML